MKPGTYVMEPKFIADPLRRQRLTRIVRVESDDGEFVEATELTTSSTEAFGKPIWTAGSRKVCSKKQWRFSAVAPA